MNLYMHDVNAIHAIIIESSDVVARVRHHTEDTLLNVYCILSCEQIFHVLFQSSNLLLR